MALCFLYTILCSTPPFYAAAQTASPVPRLIELFTSQGCSSCPPAETLLSNWGMDLFKKGKALPLAFHVDYWNYLGWKDPYSEADFSDRQKTYSLLLGDSLYTPQMVVGGRRSFVGSDQAQAANSVESPNRSRFYIRLSLTEPESPDKIHLKAFLPAGLPGGLTKNWSLYLVIFENHLVNQVLSGENGGETLEENFVVRRLQKIGKAGFSTGGSVETNLEWDPHWKRPNSGIGVFLQNNETLETDGVRWIYPIGGI